MRALLLTMLMVLGLSDAAHAQGAGQSGITNAQTAKVISAISNMFDACRPVAAVYGPDCLSRALQRGAGKITNNPGYWEAHVALTRASRSMTQLVRQYEDPQADRIRVEGYRLNAVAQSSLPTVRQAGEAIMARAQRDLEMLAPYEREAFLPIATLLRTERPWP